MSQVRDDVCHESNVATRDIVADVAHDTAVIIRDKPLRGYGESKSSSKRNSLDNKTVQNLAQDLAAECAKAYAMMENSLSKLSTDFAVGPFGLTPKSKVFFFFFFFNVGQFTPKAW